MRPQKKLNNSLPALLIMLAACGGSTHNTAVSSSPAAASAPVENTVPVPATIPCQIVNVYPHDPAAFTEGLEYRDGYLYESTGQYGQSDVRKVELATGKVIASTRMERRYFGEGLTILGDKIYQLTYREGKGFIYDLASLKQTGTFEFSAQEGWGMTNNGSALIYDDGSNVFRFIDPHTFKEMKQLAVTDEHGPVQNLNEPELIHGFIYANQWQTDNILKIDTTSGHVVGRADLSALRATLGISPPSGNRAGPDVLNGIAYDAAGNRIFITGKNWPKLAEVKLDY